MTATAAPQQIATGDTPLTLLFPDLENEVGTTRRILERVPDNNEGYRPHDKSMTLGSLATHVAQLPGFGIMMLTSDEFDMASWSMSKPANTAERLKLFDQVSAELRNLLEPMTWNRARSIWKFTYGDRVLAEAPRGNLMRTMVITHMAHHRAQLGVYLRLLGVPIPGSYGPSADEPFQ